MRLGTKIVPLLLGHFDTCLLLDQKQLSRQGVGVQIGAFVNTSKQP
jgi:hypothetical protein